MATCSVDECERIARSRGWCALHYNRWYAHGDPLVVKTARGLNTEGKLRFYGWCVTPNGCWEWRGNRTVDGYGRITLGTAKRGVAHRAAYETWVGPIPEGMMVLHKCDNPPCINPGHLYCGTQSDNMRDMATRNRARATKLTPEDVRTIRLRAAGGEPLSSLAKEYQMSYSNVWVITTRKTWRHLNG